MFSSHIELRSYHTEQTSHSHEYAQLVLPVKGVLELEIGSSAGIIDAEKAAFVATGTRHSFSGSQDNLFVVVDFSQPDSPAINMPSFITLTPVTKQFLQFAHYYLLHGVNDLSSHRLINSLLLNLLSHPILSNQDLLVLKAKNWIDLHFSTSVNLEQLAQHCHLSISQLQRRFKKNTGTGLAEYWRQKKLEHAKLLLSTTSHTITSIAFAIGYENVPAFSRRFHAVLGMYPSEWREMALTAKKLLPSDNT
ncbi:AraC family transcriptional regulator [Legionella fallonii]|uniref:Transcriptional regulator, AraC-family n=1 Tax=Legionella fallonii LLAP-10 TaxID=1212491 RepID=A0A098G390_9GAMM|nr:AraC family transcriptional regulator [Legionella fallonii]CEG56928.1 Transcriptional regulator, AraC-family [Legionella fallonii LLAP-10]